MRFLLLALCASALASCALQQSRQPGIMVTVHNVSTPEAGMAEATHDCMGYSRHAVFDHIHARSAHYRCET